MQIGQAGKRAEGGRRKRILSWEVNLCLRVILQPVVALSAGSPSVACTPAIWRGSDGVEDRLGCCLTLSFSLPLRAPSALAITLPGAEREGCLGSVVGGGGGEVARRKIQLTEKKRETRERTKHREGDRFQ